METALEWGTTESTQPSLRYMPSKCLSFFVFVAPPLRKIAISLTCSIRFSSNLEGCKNKMQHIYNQNFVQIELKQIKGVMPHF